MRTQSTGSEPGVNRAKVAALLMISSLLLLSALTPGCGAKYEGPPRDISIGIMPGIQATLIYIAQQEGFFKEYGLDVNVRDYALGVDALKGAASGEVDFGIVAEFGYVASSFSLKDVDVLASIADLNDADLVGRKDKGVSLPADLKGKKFATKAGTQFHFLLGKYLELNGLSLQDVTIVTTNNPDESKAALLSGAADATILMEPYTDAARVELGASAFVDDVQSGQYYYWPLVARRQYLQDNGEEVKRVLRALVAAEEFVAEHPSVARRDASVGMGRDLAYVRMIWPRCRFRVTLPQSMVTSMEDEASWAIANGLFGATSMPNYLDSIQVEWLQDVAPGSVTLY